MKEGSFLADPADMTRAQLEAEVRSLREGRAEHSTYISVHKVMRRWSLRPLSAKLMLFLRTQPEFFASTLAIDEALPPLDHARERDLKWVQVVIWDIRRHVGRSAIETFKGRGYRLGQAAVDDLDLVVCGAGRAP